ncbi:hypothetical protein CHINAEXTREME_10800 [Halobiforma lacisalsi AJ5]|uniref:DUF4399 domain-containing protein n=2 Tax=Natronobacterium lacisalsi TaxID=229731 RepID=M0L710_NATLA|nr:hypothetical protein CHINAEXTREME_10800 [Halobiforma lacisalsi AJ5]EMA28234.1 hypothetical protein C445_19383 [Halobiforma lacisalsi AJ5]
MEDEDESNPDDANSDPETVDEIDHENPEGSVEFVQPEDGAEVTNPVAFEAEVEGLELEPAEEEDPEDGTGHLHVIVDQGCVEPGYVIPQDEGYHHLGDGESEIELDLEPGEYDLCLQASDGIHNAYGLTDESTIEVLEEDDSESENESENESADDENGDTNGNDTE